MHPAIMTDYYRIWSTSPTRSHRPPKTHFSTCTSLLVSYRDMASERSEVWVQDQNGECWSSAKEDIKEDDTMSMASEMSRMSFEPGSIV